MFSGKIKPILAVIAVLIIQNLFIFYNHYFNDYLFPWDFLGSYHAIPYYWIEAAKHGIDFAWIPFQGMGYPLYLNLQSGLYYPPFWLFVIFDKTYTLGAAVIMQNLHVFFGAVGAVSCARLMGMRWKESLLVGVFYQGYGAFYSNAEHPDIVRTYALLPWLCGAVFAQWRDKSIFLRISILLLPLWTYGLWTGGYPGGAVASIFVLGITLLIRILHDRNNRKIGMLVLTALATGCLLAGVSLLPAILSSSDVRRASQVGGLVYDYLKVGDVFALIYRVDNSFFGHDISMRSMYVGVPVVALLFLGIKNCRQWNIWVLLTAGVSIAMAYGLLHKIVIDILPPLGYSRFTYADYRGFIGLALILIAVQGGIALQNTKNKGSYLWCVALLVFVIFGNFMLQLNRPDSRRDVGLLILAIGAVFIILTYVRHKRSEWMIPLLIVVALLDWSRVQRNQGYFNFSDGIAWVEAGTGKFIDTEKMLTARLTATDGCRPSRIDIPESNQNMKPWRGYYTGEYLMEDYSGPMKFTRQQQVLASPPLRAFASRPWVAVNVPETGLFEDSRLMESSQAPVSCVRYGTSRIEYSVNLPAPSFVVENELFWKGWSATLFTQNGDVIQKLEPTNIKGFRGWHLLQGSYTLVATFETPNENLGRLVSCAGMLVWFGLACLLWRRTKSKSNNN